MLKNQTIIKVTLTIALILTFIVDVNDVIKYAIYICILVYIFFFKKSSDKQDKENLNNRT